MPSGPAERLCIVRGGGDLATGVVWRLTRAGFPVVVTELAAPLAVRRTVALSTAVVEGTVDIEGMVGRQATSIGDAVEIARAGDVGVVVTDGLPDANADVVVDARMAKRNIDTTITDAPTVIGLGPGFTAGVDCHAVVETMRGHHLGRVIRSGSAAPNTGRAPATAGHGTERVLRAPADGNVDWYVSIGDLVATGTVLGTVSATPITAPFHGVIRGLISPTTTVTTDLKIGDVDPRLDVDCDEISDKALAIGGGVVEAVLDHR